jgi:hypothetical protein
MYIFVIDPGASRLKAIASDSRGKPQFLSMSPYCADVGFAEGDRLKQIWSGDVSIESSWVSDLDGCYLLGEGAQKYHASGLANNELKYKKALYKALGVIGYFAKELNIPNRASIGVGVLLPFNEYATKEQFTNWFSLAIQQFSYCGKTMGFELAELAIRPEGSGTYLKGLPKRIQPKAVKVASLVIGHRNASWLVNDKGYPSLAASTTCDLGYRWLIEEIKQQTGHKNEMWIAHQIFAKGEDEICLLAESLMLSYWRQIYNWIREQSPVDYVVVSGGTGLLLRQLIDECLENVIWPETLLTEVLKYEANESMAFRYIDSFGVYKSIEAKVRAMV